MKINWSLVGLWMLLVPLILVSAFLIFTLFSLEPKMGALMVAGLGYVCAAFFLLMKGPSA